MKKLLTIMTLLWTFSIALTACSSVEGNQGGASSFANEATEQATKATAVPVGAIIESYRAPADVVEIDMTEEDPSNDEIKFEYDDEGKISGCRYQIDGTDVYVGYSYKDDYVEMFGFIGDIVVADDIFYISNFDSSQGFVEYEGYYFKGVAPVVEN